MSSSTDSLTVLLLLLLLILTESPPYDASSPTNPTVKDDRRKIIIDITHPYYESLPYGSSSVGKFVKLVRSMADGDDLNFSEIRLPAHAGTHVDAPGHVFQNYFEAGLDVDSLDLDVLNGPALLVDVPRDQNITAKVMESLHIPRGVRRVLFRTLNTERELMSRTRLVTDSVGFTTDGAKWLLDNTSIKLVGIDYVSIAAYDDLFPAHRVFLGTRDIIVVETLKLDNVQPGMYALHCLPLRLRGADGSPIRCILIK